MLSDLASLIAKAVDLKQGDKEFALYRYYDGTWSAGIGNTSRHVMIGEAEAEFSGEGATPEEALVQLIARLEGSS